MRVRWTRPALDTLAEIQVFIAKENPDAARKIGRSIRASTRRLGAHPLSGRTGHVPGTRELVVPGLPFIIAYRVTESVEILALRHDAQKRRQPDI